MNCRLDFSLSKSSILSIFFPFHIIHFFHLHMISPFVLPSSQFPLHPLSLSQNPQPSNILTQSDPFISSWNLLSISNIHTIITFENLTQMHNRSQSLYFPLWNAPFADRCWSSRSSQLPTVARSCTINEPAKKTDGQKFSSLTVTWELSKYRNLVQGKNVERRLEEKTGLRMEEETRNCEVSWQNQAYVAWLCYWDNGQLSELGRHRSISIFSYDRRWLLHKMKKVKIDLWR